MDSDTACKALLMAEQAEAIQNLDPYQSQNDNLDWLWNSVKQLAPMGLEIQYAMCQLAVIFGRSAIEQPDIMHILNQSDLNKETRIQTIVSSLMNRTIYH